MPSVLLTHLRLFGLLTVTIAAGSCWSTTASAEEKTDAKPAEMKINYQDHILPIFRAKCGGCHGADQAKGGLVLDSYSAAMTGGASGTVIEGGDLGNSRLWELVTHSADPKMPPREKLPDDMLASIQKWIEGGALENSGSKAKVSKKPNLALMTDISTDKPAGPPPMPENLSTEPLTLSARGNAVTALAASPWAPLAAVAGHKQVLLYNLTDLTLAGVLPFPEGTVHVLRFSRNGSLLLAAGGRGGQSGRAVVFDVKTGKRITEVGAEYDAVLAADISPNHSAVALGGPQKLVRIYSTADGELLYEMKKHTDWVTAIEFSPDGVLLATGDRSNGLVVWEANTGREFYTMTGHAAQITGLSWRIDSNILSSSSEDGTVRLWEMNNGTQVKTWNAHGGGSGSVQFLRDGRLVSTGRDRITKLWDQNGAQVRAFAALPDLGLKAAYDETTGNVLAGDWTGTVKLWDAKDGADRGTLVTNPAALNVRLEEAAKLANEAQAAADQASAQVAALQKAAADKKAAADAAVKLFNDTQATVTALQTAKTDAEKLAAEKTAALTAAQAAVTTATAAFDKAKADKEAAEKAEDKKDVPATTEAFNAAEKALADTKKVAETLTAEKDAAAKNAADLTAKHKAESDRLPGLKAASDKAVADANPTPETTKALAEATARAEQAAAAAAARKVIAEKLTAEKNRPADPTSVATPIK